MKLSANLVPAQNKGTISSSELFIFKWNPSIHCVIKVIYQRLENVRNIENRVKAQVFNRLLPGCRTCLLKEQRSCA